MKPAPPVMNIFEPDGSRLARAASFAMGSFRRVHDLAKPQCRFPARPPQSQIASHHVAADPPRENEVCSGAELTLLRADELQEADIFVPAQIVAACRYPPGDPE